MNISEITYRFQTARPEVRQLLPRYLLPWLDNIELVDPNVPPTNPLSYFQVIYIVYELKFGYRLFDAIIRQFCISALLLNRDKTYELSSGRSRIC